MRSAQGGHLGCPPCCDSQPIASASEAAEVTATTEIATAIGQIGEIVRLRLGDAK